MRSTFLVCMAALLFACNSPGKKENKDEAVTISAVKLTADKVPATIVMAELDEAWQWTDKSGENIIVLCYVEPYDDKEKNEYGEEGKTAKLLAAQYLKTKDQYSLIWTVDEVEKSCPFDITCGFIKDATTITDLDKDGMAETTILYRLACRSDVSPAEMKLVMHEGSARYSLKGLSWLRSSPEDSFTVTEKDVNLEALRSSSKAEEHYTRLFGRYETEKEFSPAPPVFLDHARKQWMKFVIERME